MCGVSECDREASILRRPWPTGGCCAVGEIYSNEYEGEADDVNKVRGEDR